MSARRFIKLVKESAWGVPMEEPVAGVDAIYLRLGDGTDFTENPIVLETPYGGGYTTAACADSDQSEVTGTLVTNLYPSQAPFLLHWWLTRINALRTTPWATANDGYSPPNDLASVSIYEGVREIDGTTTRLAYRGCKVASGSLTAGQDGEARKFSISLSIRGAKDVEEVDDEEFPDPVEADYPCGSYMFSDLDGAFKIGVLRDFIDSVTFSVENTIDFPYSMGRYPKRINTYGRNTTLSVGLLRTTTPDDYAAFRSVVDQDAEFTINNGSKSVKIDLHGKNHWQTLGKRFPDGSYYAYDAVLKNRFDPGQAVDLTVTAT